MPPNVEFEVKETFGSYYIEIFGSLIFIQGSNTAGFLINNYMTHITF